MDNFGFLEKARFELKKSQRSAKKMLGGLK
jgi:hypothetical protein